MTTNIEYLHEVVNRPEFQQIMDDINAVKGTFQGEPLFVHADAAVNVLRNLKGAVTLPVAFTPPAPSTPEA